MHMNLTGLGGFGIIQPLSEAISDCERPVEDLEVLHHVRCLVGPRPSNNWQPALHKPSQRNLVVVVEDSG